MRRYVLSKHARERMKERGLSEELVRSALQKPTTVGYDRNGHVLVKKRYARGRRDRLLLVAGVFLSDGTFKILTVIGYIESQKVSMKRKPKISYDKESEVLSLEVGKGKSVDSDISGNVVIDYDGKRDVVRVNVYNISFDDFKRSAHSIKQVAQVV